MFSERVIFTVRFGLLQFFLIDSPYLEKIVVIPRGLLVKKPLMFRKHNTCFIFNAQIAAIFKLAVGGSANKNLAMQSK